MLYLLEVYPKKLNRVVWNVSGKSTKNRLVPLLQRQIHFLVYRKSPPVRLDWDEKRSEARIRHREGDVGEMKSEG